MKTYQLVERDVSYNLLSSQNKIKGYLWYYKKAPEPNKLKCTFEIQ
jgi:hypothetical protein